MDEPLNPEPFVFDGWINLPIPPGEVTFDPRAASLFGSADYAKGSTMDDLIRILDANGVSGGVLTKTPRAITAPFVGGMVVDDSVVHRECEALARAQAEHPGRFVTAITLDPRLAYDAARHVRIAVEEYGVGAIRITGMFSDLPIDDRLAFPLYTAACDLGIPVTVNVGFPGPLKPARNQDPMGVDEVALAFPPLSIVMTHVGDPWVPIVAALLNKHANVTLMTSGWAPKRVPEVLMHLQNRRNPEKLMWASDYPVLTVERTVAEGRVVPLDAGPLAAYLGGNALRVFGKPR